MLHLLRHKSLILEEWIPWKVLIQHWESRVDSRRREEVSQRHPHPLSFQFLRYGRRIRGMVAAFQLINLAWELSMHLTLWKS